jgi:predicted dehydrogenase
VLPMSQVNLGVVGVGEVGESVGLALAADSRVRLVAVCDSSVPTMDRFAQRLPQAPTQFTDYRALLAEEDVHGVFIGVPNSLHAPVIIEALGRKKHVLITKPLAGSLAEATSVVRHMSHETVAMMAMPKRYEEPVHYLAQLAEDGYFGEIYHARVRVARRSGIPSWSTATIGPGGGAMRDMGVHFVDAAWWLMGRPTPTSVLGVSGAKFGPTGQGYWKFGKPPPDYIERFASDDYACGTASFANGAAMQVESFWAGHLQQEDQLEIMGTKAGARISPLTLFTTRNGAPCDTTITIPRGPANPRAVDPAREIPTHWRRISSHFVSCILGEESCDVPIQDGFTVQWILESLLDSQGERHTFPNAQATGYEPKARQ